MGGASLPASPAGCPVLTLALIALPLVAQGVSSLPGSPRPGAITSYCVNHDASVVAVSADDNVVHLVPMVSGAASPAQFVTSDSLYCAEFSPDGKRFAAWSPGCRACIYEVKSGKLVYSLDVPTAGGCDGAHGTLKFSADGTHLIAVGASPRAILWDLASGKQIAGLGDEKEGTVQFAAWGPDSHLIATSTNRGVVRVWDGANGDPRSGPITTPARANSLAMDPKGVRIAMGCDDGFVRIAAIARGEIERVLSYEDQPFFGEVTASVEAFSPDGEHILTTSYSFEGVRSWNVMSGKEEWRNDADIYDGGGISVKYAENGATAFLSRRARFIDAKSGHTLRELGSDRSLIYSMSADGNHVLGIEAGVVVVLDAKTFTPQSRIRVGGSVGVSVQKEPEKDASGR